MGHFQLSECDSKGDKGSRIQGFEKSSTEQEDKIAKELQRFESLAKEIKDSRIQGFRGSSEILRN